MGTTLIGRDNNSGGLAFVTPMKLVVLIVAIFGTLGVLIVRYSVQLSLCLATDTDCRITWDVLENVLYFSPLVLLFSIVTFWLPVRTFSSWFNFLLAWGSLTLLITIFVHLGYFESDRPDLLGMGNAFNMLIILFMYTIFVLGSIISIVRGYNSNQPLK